MVRNIANQTQSVTGVVGGSQTAVQFNKEIKLAQIAIPMPVIVPITGAEGGSFGGLRPKTPSINYRPSNLPQVKYLLNEQSLRQALTRYPNAKQANAVLIKSMKEWSNDPISKKTPALRTQVQSYILMADTSDKPKKGLSRADKAKSNSDGTERRPNGKPPQKPEPPTRKIASETRKNVEDLVRLDTIRTKLNQKFEKPFGDRTIKQSEVEIIQLRRIELKDLKARESKLEPEYKKIQQEVDRIKQKALENRSQSEQDLVRKNYKLYENLQKIYRRISVLEINLRNISH